MLMRILFKSTWNLALVLFLLSLILSSLPACKGCNGDESNQSALDANADAATDTAKKVNRKRKRKKRTRVKSVQEKEAPPRRKPNRSSAKPSEEPKAKTSVKAEKSKPRPAKQAEPAPEKQSARKDVKPAKAQDVKKPEPRKAAAPQKAPETIRVQALQIKDFVQVTELIQILKQPNGMVDAPIQGQEITSDYNHMRLVTVGQKDSLGLVVQVWRDPNVPEARERFNSFLKSYPGAKANQSVTRKTFFAQYGDRSYAGFLATGQRTNVVLTCNTTLCSPEQLHSVAIAIKKRLVRR